MAKPNRFTEFKQHKPSIRYNYSVNEQGQVLHRVGLPNGNGVLRTSLELVTMGLLNKNDTKYNQVKVGN